MKDNLTIIQESYACGEKGDMPGLLKDMNADGKWTEMAGNVYAGTYTGSDEILKNVFARIGGEWKSFAAIPREFLDAGDKVIVLGNYVGVHLKTDRSMDIRYTHVWTLKDGKIENFEQFTDTAILRWAADEPYSE